jgi:glycosyltransferase involved in cell wall biosynthesis
MNPVIVTFDVPVNDALPDGTRIVSCVPSSSVASSRLVLAVLYRLERFIVFLCKGYLEKITGKKPGTYHSAVLPLVYAYRMARIADSFQPRFVFGQEVLSYGLATALCRNTRRVIFPWGGDVYSYAESSILAYYIAKRALRSVDLIVPSSTSSIGHIAQRFAVNSAKIRAISWGVDRGLFRQASTEQRNRILLKYRIPADSIVFLNVRRFMPLWGCFTVLEIFARLATDDPRYHFVMLGGPGTEHYVRAAKDKVESENLQDRFTLIDGEIPLNEVAELMSIADVSFSLMKHSEMRSFSVLQAAASGAVPVVSDNDEFKSMAEKGFMALFVYPDDVDGALRLTRLCMNDESLRARIRENNSKYIAEFEDYHTKMEELLNLCIST